MQYAIELYYDKETEQSLANLVQLVADKKLSTTFFGMENKTTSYIGLFQ